jgi:hypothetical protein
MLRKILTRATMPSKSDGAFSFYFVWLLSFLISAPMPSDDLLRDTIIGSYNFNYANLYIYAKLMVTYNQYIAFDHLLNILVSSVGRIWTVRIVQLFCVINFVVPLHLIFRSLLKERDDAHIVIVALLAVALNYMVVLRLYLGRPEVIFAGWVLWGIYAGIFSQRALKLAWVIYGIILIPFYWLSIVYSFTAVVVFRRYKSKIIVLLLLMLANIIFWQIYSNDLWLDTFRLLKLQLDNRYGDLVVTENNSILFSLLNPAFTVIIASIIYKVIPKYKEVLQAWRIWPTKYQFWIVALAGWYLMPNMIRYGDVIVPLFVVIFIYQYRDVPFSLNRPFVKNLVVLLSCFSIFYANQHFRQPCRFADLPAGARVLTTFNGLNYYLPFYSKHNIQIAPSMEIGANDQGVQKLIYTIQSKGTLDCNELKKYNFTFVAERSLLEVPKCLTIFGVNGEYRIWKIK